MNILIFFSFSYTFLFFLPVNYFWGIKPKIKCKKIQKAKLQDAAFWATTNICLSPWFITSQLFARDEMWERNVYILWPEYLIPDDKGF